MKMVPLISFKNCSAYHFYTSQILFGNAHKKRALPEKYSSKALFLGLFFQNSKACICRGYTTSNSPNLGGTLVLPNRCAEVLHPDVIHEGNAHFGEPAPHQVNAVARAFFPCEQRFLKIVVAFGNVFTYSLPFIARLFGTLAEVAAVGATMGKKIVLLHVSGMGECGLFQPGVPSQRPNRRHVLSTTLAALRTKPIDLG